MQKYLILSFRPKQEILLLRGSVTNPQGKGADRADLDAGKTVQAGRAFLCPVKADDRAKTSPGESHQGSPVAGCASPHAPGAKDAAVGVVVDQGMVPDDGRLFEIGPKSFGLQPHTEELGRILESAFLVCGTVSAVHIVNRQKEPQSADLKGPHPGGIRLHPHSFSDLNGAGGNRLFHPFDFNKAQPARGMGFFRPFEMTEIGDVDTMVQARVEKYCPFLDLQLSVVDNHFDHLRYVLDTLFL